jgi:hypothetical protein
VVPTRRLMRLAPKACYTLAVRFGAARLGYGRSQERPIRGIVCGWFGTSPRPFKRCCSWAAVELSKAPRTLFGTNLLWTNPDEPGLREAAEVLGYEGGSSMSFLRLRAVVFPDGQPPVPGLADIDNRLNVATAAQVAALSRSLPIL